jgi:peroxiredoxin
MDGVLHDTAGVLRFILLVGFLFAGVAKFRNSAQTRQMLVEFGVPSQLVGAGALALPLLEILTAAALAMSETIGGWLALALLLTFSAAIQANLSLGRHPDCHCFGQLKAYPIGRPLLVRNAVLALAAATVIWMSGHSTISPTAALLEQMTAGQRVILILSGIQMFAIVVLGVVAWQIVRQQGRMLIRLDRLERTPGGEGWTERMPELRIGVPMGASAPNFALSNVEGAQVRLKELLGRGALVLVFSSPHCGPCQQLQPQLKIWTERFQDRLTIVIVSEGSAVDHKSYPIPERVLLQHQREVAEQYQAWGTPSAVLVRPDGSIGSGVAAGAEQIGALVEHVGGGPNPVYRV